ncbi:MAG TPA: CDC27 family protein [Woeseiaceae bacterium]|nr:CDC27 family protein [Woeseiaceae bacterium]
MSILSRISPKISLAVIAMALASSGAFAQDDERAERDAQKTKQAQAVSKEVYDKIQKAQEQVDAKDYQGALRALNALYDPDRLTEYEQANVLNYIGFVYYNMEDIPNAIRTYEKLVVIPSLEPQMGKQTMYTLAQLYTMEENYQKALQTLERWFALEPNPAPEPFILKAQNLYQLQRYQEMIKPIESAMRIARERDKPVKEDWYVLLNFAYFQEEEYREVRDIQKILLENWPKKRYWFSLAGAYTELGEDNNLIASYGAAHDQGLLEKESELVTMAQLYMQAEVPYKAAKLLEKEMEAGRVNKNAKNYRLLSQAWMLSQEDERAIPALKEAAKLSDDGELDVRLGNTYLNLGEYDECINAVQAGLRKGGLKNPDNAQISLGMCLYNKRRYQAAIDAFRAASKTPRSRKVAQQWITVINADVERNEQIRLAQEAATKKRKEVEARRKQADRA